MAFKATNVITSDAYLTVKRAATQLRVNLVSFNSQLASSGADYGFLQTIFLTLQRADNQFNTLKATPGLAQYAKDQEDDQAYDVVAEFTAMQAEITAAGAWLNANVPLNVTAKSVLSWDDTTLIEDSFSVGQTNGLRTALQGVIDSIA